MTEQVGKVEEKKQTIDIIKPETLFMRLNQYLALKVDTNTKISDMSENIKALKKDLKNIDARIIETHRLLRSYTIKNKMLNGTLKLEDFDEKTLREVYVTIRAVDDEE